MKDFLSNTADNISNTAKKVSNKYEMHIREKAMEAVNEKIKNKGLVLEEIDPADYEAMINDVAKDIKADYSKKAAYAGFALLGFDLLFGF